MQGIENLKMMAEKGDPEAQFQLGTVYFQNGNFQEAQKCFEKVKNNKEHPYYAGVVGSLAMLYEIEGTPLYNRDEAIRIFESIKDTVEYPRNIIIKLHLALLYLEGVDRGKFAEGKELLKEALHLNKTGVDSDIDTLKRALENDQGDALSYDHYDRAGNVFYDGKMNESCTVNTEDIEKAIAFLEKAKYEMERDTFTVDGQKEMMRKKLESAKKGLAARKEMEKIAECV